MNNAQTQFLEQTRQALLWITGLAGGLALILGVGFSILLSRPIRELTGAARAVADGQLGREAPIYHGAGEEITALGKSFNQMSKALAEGEERRKRMTADIAHELRTPLSVMRSQLQAMLDNVIPTDEEQVAIVYNQALHLNRLVEDLRTLTQAEAGHLPLQQTLIRPEDMVKRAVTLFEPLAQDAGLRLSSACDGDLPEILTDADRLQQVFGNLLANALRHTPSGGVIQVHVGPGEAKGVRFQVSNDGVTLTQEQAERVFERFWRADESRSRDQGGAGLGLAISRQIVHLHGGRIWVELDSNKTHFVFEIPGSQG
jgi:two-component system OmpR family sensor kinase/two-component system sensor histidine kinase BaeS